jgi:hypothetical protein
VGSLIFVSESSLTLFARQRIPLHVKHKVKDDSETKISDPTNAMLAKQGDGSFEYRV